MRPPRGTAAAAVAVAFGVACLVGIAGRARAQDAAVLDGAAPDAGVSADAVAVERPDAAAAAPRDAGARPSGRGGVAAAVDAGPPEPEPGDEIPIPEAGTERDADGHRRDGSGAAGNAPDDDGDNADEGDDAPRPIRYFLERVEVRGNSRTSAAIVRRFVPIRRGEVLDVDDPAIETIRWRLLGTGWFYDVRLRLLRGLERGWVVLVIEVEERNTLVVQSLTFGVAEGVRTSGDMTPSLEPYVGLALADTNLFGTGITVSASGLVSVPQQGLRLRFADPMFLSSEFGFDASLFFNNSREFFGGEDDTLVSIRCPPPDPTTGEVPVCPPEVEAKSAVVVYRRYGVSLGTGHDMGATTRYTLDWQGELVDVIVRPDAASELRGRGARSEVVPIDFAINNGVSFVSTIQLGLVYDRRDDPALPSRGTLVQFRGDAGSRIIFGDYDFLRLEVLARQWVPLPWGHVLRFSGFAGAIFGRAPFFYLFYVSDLSDLIPSRVLEMNLDRRAPPDLLGTAISEMRTGEIAARIDVEYSVPLYRGGNGFRALDAYLNLGAYAITMRRDLRVAIPGYDGASRIPVDVTFDLGVRADTDIGVFQLGFSNLFGFIRL